jgi:hypothetical protein
MGLVNPEDNIKQIVGLVLLVTSVRLARNKSTPVLVYSEENRTRDLTLDPSNTDILVFIYLFVIYLTIQYAKQ